MISARDISVRFGERTALDAVSLHVRPGELVGLVGASASGTTVLLKSLCLLVRPDAGEVRLGGRNLGELSRQALAGVRADVGFAFQGLALFDHLTAVQNVAFALTRRGVPEAEALARAAEQLRAVGLAAAAQKRPHELSGEMQRRLALARAMVARPKIALFDDPFVGLDPVACARIARLIARSHAETGATTIVAAGDPGPLFSVAERLVLLERGRVAADLPAEAFARSEDEAVARYLGRGAGGTVLKNPPVEERAPPPGETFVSIRPFVAPASPADCAGEAAEGLFQSKPVAASDAAPENGSPPLPKREPVLRAGHANRMIAALGAGVLAVIQELGGLMLLGARCVRAVFGRAFEWREALRQADSFGVGSLAVLSATAALVGGILVVQAGLYVQRFGVQELVGWFIGFGVLREVGPLVAGLVFSGRVGSRNAAEIAAMSTRDQLAGLRALGIDLVPAVVAPRAAAMFVSLVGLFFVGALVSVATAAAGSWVLLDVDWPQFERSFLSRTRLEDLTAGIAKSAVFAGAVALVSCRAGLLARGGAAAVGEAAKRAVVQGAFAIVMLDLLVARFFG